MQQPFVRAFFDPITATWSYVVWQDLEISRLCAVIDPVLDFSLFSCSTSTQSSDRIIAFIEEKGLEVEWILETHIHADHLSAAQHIKERKGGKIAISKHILPVLATWQDYFHNEADTPLDGSQFDYLFEDDATFQIGSMAARIIHTPGHTPADTCYIIEENAIFVGDAMFLPDVGSGRCDFPGGSAEDSYASSRKLFSLPDTMRMYVGHDYPPAARGPQCMSTIAEQKKNNIRLKEGITQDEFIAWRKRDDTGKSVPELLLPSIQVNLRAGRFGDAVQGTQYLTLPLNRL